MKNFGNESRNFSLVWLLLNKTSSKLNTRSAAALVTPGDIIDDEDDVGLFPIPPPASDAKDIGDADLTWLFEVSKELADPKAREVDDGDFPPVPPPPPLLTLLLPGVIGCCSLPGEASLSDRDEFRPRENEEEATELLRLLESLNSKTRSSRNECISDSAKLVRLHNSTNLSMLRCSSK
jgi:hypothetical protein